MNVCEVQVQMIDISTYHSIEGNPTTLIVNPVVVEFSLIYGADDVADVLIVVFEQHHQGVPILMLIVL